VSDDRERSRETEAAIPVGALTVVIVVGGGALVRASVPHSFNTGDTLQAVDLNGNFAALDQRIAALEAGLPSGTIVAYGGPAGTAGDGGASALPSGWLLCDGSAVSRTTYAALFAAVGINFGGGDGVGTFNLPDLRGRFPRGADHGAGRDSDSAGRAASATGDPAGDVVGSMETDSFRTHDHGGSTSGVSNFSGTDGYRDYNANGCGQSGNGFSYITTQTCLSGQFSTHTHGIAAAGGTETRPVNIAVTTSLSSKSCEYLCDG
jgi:hypothetical protein